MSDSRNLDDEIEYLIENKVGEFTERYALKDERVESRYGREVLAKAKTLDGGEEIVAAPEARKRIETPYAVRDLPIWLGIDTKTKTEVGIPRERFFQHTLILGGTGVGKTTLLNNIHQQLIHSNTGLALIDGKGDNCGHLMERIPEWRMDDVVYLDPGGTNGYVSGFNYLNVGRTPEDPSYDALIRSITRNLLILLEVEGEIEDRFENILVEVVDAIIRSDVQLTLADLHELLGRLQDEDTDLIRGPTERDEPARSFEDEWDGASGRIFREILETNTEIREALSHFDSIPDKQIDRFNEGLASLLRKKQLRHLTCQRGSPLEIARAVDQDKIILLRLTGDTETHRRVGTAFLRRLWSVLRSRTDVDEANRNPFFVSIDEGQNVVRDSSTISEMLREARGFNVGILFATQNLAGIDHETTQQLYANSETILSFNPGSHKQAKTMSRQLNVEPQTLMDESNHHIWLRVDLPEKGKRTDPIRTYTFPPYPPMRTREDRDEAILERIKLYGQKEDDMSAFAPISDLSLFN